MTWEGRDPAALLEHLMADGRCVAFGPVHHFLVGAALLTCARESLPLPLPDALSALAQRSQCVPGASCAHWGVCGAAASAGMAFAILAQNAPLKEAGWSQGQLMVADILGKIARAGAPRCCKRDSRIAVRVAVPWFNRELGAGLEEAGADPACAVVDCNAACLGPSCPYHPGQ